MQAVPSTYQQCVKFPHNGQEITTLANSNQYYNNLKLVQDARVPYNREAVYHTKETQEKIWENFKKMLKLNDEGMGKYSLPLSPKSYGKPTNTQPRISHKSVKMFDGAFARDGTLSEETEDKDILNWLYKDENETIATTTEVSIPIEHYGNGYKIMQKIGYEGKGQIGKHREGILEPIFSHTQSKEDILGLGYSRSNQKQHTYQHPK